jgi:hypothetical protein
MDAFEYKAFINRGLELSIFKSVFRASALHFFVKERRKKKIFFFFLPPSLLCFLRVVHLVGYIFLFQE